MRRLGLGTVSCIVFGLVWACGGADTSLTGGDGGDSGPAADSGPTGDSGPNGDSGGDATPTATCDGGTVACGSQCVDTSSDPKNCGGCGIVCNTQCSAGVCQLIGSSCDGGTPAQVQDNACLTVDATNVYWATGLANGSVWSLPLAGGCPMQVIGNQASPHGMASDGTNLFFADEGTFNTSTGSIQRIPIGGGNPTSIATSQPFPLDVVVDATNVYWTNGGDGSVWKSDKANPNPVKLAGPAGQGHAAYLRVDATNVYFTDPGGGVVKRVPIAGGTVTTMTTQVTNVGHIAIDATNAYYASRGQTTSALMSIALNASAGTPNQLVPSLPALNGIQTDGASIWFAEATNVQPYQQNSGEIHRVTVGGTNDTPLATKQNGPNCISVDATSVYWINSGGGMISKTAK